MNEDGPWLHRQDVTSQAQHGEAREEVAFSTVWRAAVTRWYLIVGAVGLMMAIAVVRLLISDVTYTAWMDVEPTYLIGEEAGIGVGRNLLALTNIDPRMSSSPYQTYLRLLSSVRVSEILTEEHDALRSFFSSQWDATAERWSPPTGVLATVRMTIFEIFGLPGWLPPDATELARRISESLTIEETDNAIRRLKFTAAAPDLARIQLNDIHRAANEVLRRREEERLKGYLTYIEEKLKNVAASEYRAALITLLAQQEKSLMVIESGAPLGAAVLDGPNVAARPTSPRVILTLAVGVLAGVALGIFMIFVAAGREVK